MIKRVFIGADHAGIILKKNLKDYLKSQNYEVTDCGSYEEEKSVDYPDFAHMVCNKVLSEKSLGILICGSGVGMSIVANRYPGIRAALCWNAEVTISARAHDDANILVLGARFINYETAQSCLNAFLETPFEGGRHQRRLEKIEPPCSSK